MILGFQADPGFQDDLMTLGWNKGMQQSEAK
jgi:hypothetical protein